MPLGGTDVRVAGLTAAAGEDTPPAAALAAADVDAGGTGTPTGSVLGYGLRVPAVAAAIGLLPVAVATHGLCCSDNQEENTMTLF